MYFRTDESFGVATCSQPPGNSSCSASIKNVTARAGAQTAQLPTSAHRILREKEISRRAVVDLSDESEVILAIEDPRERTVNRSVIQLRA
jgi:hypothetical protein